MRANGFFRKVWMERDRHSLIMEIGLTSQCRFGCKIFSCKCGENHDIHISAYGCKGI